MSNPIADDETPLDAEAARIVARVKRLMVISALTTMIAIAAVLGVIGYRVYRAGGTAVPPADLTSLLPKGARVVATAVSQDRIVITLEIGAATEIRTFDLNTLHQTGRLRFATEP